MSANTTVEVKKTTAKVLEELKNKYKAKSMDETVMKLISKAEHVPDSMFGAHPKMRSFTKSDEGRYHEI
jgi:hypothetical protein